MSHPKSLAVVLRIATPILLALLASLAATGTASAKGDDFCIPVRGVITSEFTAEGCASPIGLCTEGRITHGGLINGKTFFTALGAAPAAGMPGVEPDTTLSYAGTLEVHTRHGDLMIEDVGISDGANAVFTEVDRIVAGTRLFKNASGTWFISGDATADGSGFSGRIRGQICIAR